MTFQPANRSLCGRPPVPAAVHRGRPPRVGPTRTPRGWGDPLRALLAAALLLGTPLFALPPGAAGQAGSVSPAEPARPSTSQAAPGADAPNEPQDILLSLRMGRLADHLTPAVRTDASVYLPAAIFFEMAEIRFMESGDGRLQATRQPGAIPILLDAASGRVWYDRQEIPGVGADLLRSAGEGVLVTPELLERLLEVTIRTDLVELTATVLDPEGLPIGRRVARERRWRMMQGDGPRSLADLTLGPTPFRTGGMVMDWSASAALDAPEETAQLSLGAGAQLLGGSLQITTRNVGPLAERQLHTGASYHMAWPRRRVLRQLRLGDGIGSGPRPRSVRGLHLTNAPYVRETFFGLGEFRGRLGPGWEVELRQHGRTVDMTRADEQGAFALDVPLSYGTNPIEVVAYGAHGEVVTMDRVMLLRHDRLPGRTFEWGLSGGECGSPTCRGTGNLDLRYGLTDRWTVRAGVDAFARDTIPEAIHPYLEISGALRPTLHVSVEGVNEGFLRGVGLYSPTPGLRVRAAYTHFQVGVEAPALHDPRRRATFETDLQWRPIPGSNRWSLRGSAVREVREADLRLRWQASTSLLFRGLRLETGLRDHGSPGPRARSDSDPDPVEDPLRTLRPMASLRGRVPIPSPTSLSPWIHGEVEFEGWESLAQGRLRLTYPLRPSTQLEFTGAWDARFGTRITAGLSAALDPVRAVTQVMGGTGEEIRTVQYAQGNVQWNEATGGLRLDSGPGVERSGLSGYVFLDENGNGRLDPGEPVLSGVRVVVEGRSVTTDEVGRYTVWDLVPYELNRVHIDPISIPDPRWVPAIGTVDLPLPPSTYRRLDLAVVPGAEVTGRVVRVTPEGREEPLPGLDLLIRDLSRPGETSEVTTFSDGGFYVMGLRPGAYEFQVPPELLDRIRLRQDHPDRAVVVDRNGAAGAREIVIRLVSGSEHATSPH